MFVYHGSSKKKNTSQPKKHTRTKTLNGKKEVIFDDISFHASPELWIALAYTYTPKTFILDSRKIFFNIELNLYKNDKKIIVHGVTSLEHSLSQLYKKGGYISSFDSKDFYHTKGLGTLECITQSFVPAQMIRYFENPIQELLNQGVEFSFLDLSEEKNSHKRNYETTRKSLM